MAFFSLISFRVMYNGMGAEMYALLLYVLTMTGTFGFMDLGIGTALARYMGMALGHQDHQAVQEYWAVGMRLGILFTAFFSLIFILAGTLVGPLWFNVSPENKTMLRWCFAMGGVSLFLSYVTEQWNRVCQVFLDFAFVNKIKLWFFLLQIFPAMFLAWRFGNPVYVLFWTAIVYVIKFVIMIIHVAKKYDLYLMPKAPFLWVRFHEIKAYMLKSFSVLLISNFFVGLDRIVLGRLASPAAFTHYGIAFATGQRAEGFSTSIVGPVFSNMNLLLKSKDEAATPAHVYDYTCQMVLNWFLLAAVVVAFFSKPLLVVWLGADLASHVQPVFIPVVLGCCINAFANLSRVALTSIDRQGMLMKSTVLSGVAMAICCYSGYKMYGIVGAGYGFLASKLPYIIMDYITVKLLGARGIYNIKTVLTAGAFLLAGGTGALLISRLSQGHQLGLVLMGGALCSALLAFVESRRAAFSAI
jgi:O-antigen/teichoic acid export membrane protein